MKKSRYEIHLDSVSPPFDLSNIRYCSTHNSHWIPGEELVGNGCPWCRLDSYKKSILKVEGENE